jgi:hypothetical protein
MYLQYVNKGLDGRCEKCRNHEYLILTCLGSMCYLHTGKIELDGNYIHAWVVYKTTPICYRYYKKHEE